MNVLLKLFKTVKRWFSKSHRMPLYYAVSESGQGFIFIGEPWRDYTVNTWRGELDGNVIMVVSRFEALGFVLPKISWEDEPVELTLSLAYGKA